MLTSNIWKCWTHHKGRTAGVWDKVHLTTIGSADRYLSTIRKRDGHCESWKHNIRVLSVKASDRSLMALMALQTKKGEICNDFTQATLIVRWCRYDGSTKVRRARWPWASTDEDVQQQTTTIVMRLCSRCRSTETLRAKEFWQAHLLRRRVAVPAPSLMEQVDHVDFATELQGHPRLLRCWEAFRCHSRLSAQQAAQKLQRHDCKP